MPCSNCKKSGHNTKTCEKQAVFNYIDDEGAINPMYIADGLEDWMMPGEIHYSEGLKKEAAIWEALRLADTGNGLTYEEVIEVVREVCTR